MKNIVKNKKYKMITLAILALVALLCLSACTGGSKASDATGELDGGLKWEYTASNKTLEITGAGAIPSYNSSSEVPWAAAFESIEKIEIDRRRLARNDRDVFLACIDGIKEEKAKLEQTADEDPFADLKRKQEELKNKKKDKNT